MAEPGFQRLVIRPQPAEGLTWVKAGYRSRDVGYLFKTDSGAFVMRGLYFGGVLRY